MKVKDVIALLQFVDPEAEFNDNKYHIVSSVVEIIKYVPTPTYIPYIPPAPDPYTWPTTDGTNITWEVKDPIDPYTYPNWSIHRWKYDPLLPPVVIC